MKGGLYLVACAVLCGCFIVFVAIPTVNAIAPVAKCQKLGK